MSSINSLKKIISLFLLCCLTLSIQAQDSGLIPNPNYIRINSVLSFKVKKLQKTYQGIGVSENEYLHLCQILSKYKITHFGKTEQSKGATIVLIKDSSIENQEGYEIIVDKKSITIKGKTDNGLYYGIKTLEQLLLSYSNEIPTMVIKDAPRFPYRSLMLDPARRFIKVEEVKQFIERMAMYKFNTLHLHLTDDQGWRIEIKKYPLLTQIGAKRASMDGDNIPESGYYTQEEIKDLVAFAAKHHIEIVPEIDVPGHSVSAIAAYPFLTCFDEKVGVRTTSGVSKELLCAGNERVYEFYKEVISEVCDLFPSKYFHIGGDEAPLEHWKKCQKCQALKQSKGYKQEQELMSYFFAQMNETLVSKGKTPLFWYELDVPNYPTNSVFFAWRMGLTPKVVKSAVENGHPIILAPGEHAYFDYPQRKGDTPEVNWGMPTLTLKQVYNMDPSYGLTKEDQKMILGVEGTLWSECVKHIDRTFYMTYPRALALAEVGWTQQENRSWQSFTDRLPTVLSELLRSGINFSVPYDLKR